jgi:hypothetical protein
VRVSVIDSRTSAEQRRLIDPPTLLINGVDPLAEPVRFDLEFAAPWSDRVGPSFGGKVAGSCY